jgi:hypothetical protein
MKRLAFALATLAALAVALPARAVLTRPDRDEEEYVELATRYPAAVSLGATGGVGVLVGQRWILTAARSASTLRAKDKLVVGGAGNEIQEIFLHPDWKAGTGPDIALVLLRSAVESIAAAPTYRLSDEAGQTVRIVGTGGTGRIGAAGGRPDGKARAAINTVDRVTAGTMELLLKGPEDASDLQGALGPGDIGAPAFVEVGATIYVAGIASRTEDSNRDGIAGSVGDREIYTRVSAFASWIDRTAADALAAEAAAAVGDTERR